MRDPHLELPTNQLKMTTAGTGGARYGVGPSKGRTNAASAPGMAEVGRHEGAPGGEVPGRDTARPGFSRAADEAVLRRVARRRPRESTQRKERVDARYSQAEKEAILTKARSLHIAGAHLVGAAVMAYVDGAFDVPGQRTQRDDLIDELTALRTQVAKIGTNVNQIAHRLNAGGHPHPVDSAVLAEAGRVLALARSAAAAIDKAADAAVSREVVGD